MFKSIVQTLTGLSVLMVVPAFAFPMHVNDSDGTLGVVDTQTGQVTLIGSLGLTMFDIAFSPEGELFGISADGLYQIDPETAQSVLVGTHNIPNGNALVFGRDGTMYAASPESTGLYTVDRRTGQSTLLGFTGFTSGGDLAFVNDTLYLASSSGLVRIDLQDLSASSLVGTFGVLDVFGIGSPGSNLLFGVAGTEIFEVDLQTGQALNAVSYQGQGLSAAFGQSFLDEAQSSEIGRTYEFDAIADQTDSVPFAIVITSTDTNGNVVTSENGSLSLFTSGGVIVDPSVVTLSNGVFEGTVTLFGDDADARLSAQRGNATGVSSTFSVSGQQYPEATALDGRVLGSGPFALELLSVGPTNSRDSIDISPDSQGFYTVSGLLSGTYVIRGTCSTGNVPVEVIEVVNGTRLTKNLTCQPTAHTPVLIVPGIMGSSEARSPALIYPRLPRHTAEEGTLHIHKPSAQGVTTLKETLDFNFRTIDVPWDWRVTLDPFGGPSAAGDACPANSPDYVVGVSAWEKYLLPVIDRAKDPNCDGIDEFSKVSVVAHSMGGLLVRAYIQSSVYPDRNDIDKFVMLGTPNLGASDAYYMWQGGDPELADSISLDPWYSEDQLSAGEAALEFLKGAIIGNFRERTLAIAFARNLGSIQVPEFGSNVPAVAGNDPRRRWYMTQFAVRGFLNTRVPTVGELTPTYPFLEAIGADLAPLTVAPNIFLNNLNSSQSILRMDRLDPTKVRTRLFASQKRETIEVIRIRQREPEDNPDLYLDGIPWEGGLVRVAAGDGTVLDYSALGVGTHLGNMAELPDIGDADGKHTAMFSDFLEPVNDFLCDERVPACISPGSSPSVFPRRLSEPQPRLFIGLRSRNPPLIEEIGSGLKSGVDPVTLEYFNEITTAGLSLSPSFSTVSILNPADSSHRITIGGVYTNDLVEISVAYQDPASDVVSSTGFFGFYGDQPLTFEVSVDDSAEPELSLSMPPMPVEVGPTDMGGSLAISWLPPAGGGVVEYQVYGKQTTRPFFELVGTTTNTEFNTGQPLVADEKSQGTWTYFVQAVDESGRQSFFDNEVTNRIFTAADFSSDVVTGVAPLTVSFVDASIGEPTEWNWDLNGDGVNDSTSRNPVFAYDSPGVYNVALTVSGLAGADSTTKVGYIFVDEDSDGDGIGDTSDNCAQTANSEQRDTDDDGYGNFCDADLNNDCIVNVQDLGIFRSRFFSENEDADFSGDGIVNAVDLGLLRLRFFLPPGPSSQSDLCSNSP